MSTVIETPSKEAAHASPNALSQALSFAAAQLPLRSLDFPAAPADPERFSLLDCLEDPREKGVVYGVGAWRAGDIEGMPAMDEAYAMGRGV